MNIWKISIQNIKSKPLYTFLSVLILALSIALLLGVQQLKGSFKHHMDNNLGEIDLVVGAKGSPLQLVLASILHIDNPTGNISYKEAMGLGKNPMINTAVPISYGDNYKGFKIVGTTKDYYSLYNATLQDGREVNKSMEVVLGDAVARQLNLKIGDTFLSSHGLVENDIEVHDEELIVVGILKPTQKVIDRLIITSLESVWHVHEHETVEEKENHLEFDKDGKSHEKSNGVEQNHNHDAEKEITSLLIKFRSPAALLTFPRRINEGTNMQAVLPKYELDRLYEFTGVGFNTITWIAYLILIISGMTIFISIYKMVKDRAFDLALLRTYGASNFQLIKMVVYEGLIIAVTAFILAFIFVKIGFYTLFKFKKGDAIQSILQEVSLNQIFQTGTLVFVMVILSISLALYPLIKMNVSTILSNEK